MDSSYNPPLSLTIIGTIFIGLTTLVAAWITYDIITRRGWETMMAVMIPVYILNALYLAPITLWTYLNYGRPVKPTSKGVKPGGRVDGDGDVNSTPSNTGLEEGAVHGEHDMSGHEHMHMHMHTEGHDHGVGSLDHMNALAEAHKMTSGGDTHDAGHDMTGKQLNMSSMDHMNHGAMNHGAMHNMHMPSPDQPMFPTVTIAVCHCGAGCLLGDIVGEWLVVGTNLSINGRSIWPEFLLDYAFALLFGIFFQYFAIAPMSGDYGPKTLWRAAKADFLSLTFFEMGLFGWMAIFQLAIFDSKLGVSNVVYWWMMQIGMFWGHWTAFPINWWLISSGVKERTS